MNSANRAQFGERPPVKQRWGLPARVAVSCVLAVHLLAIVVGPWSGPPPASRLSEAFASFLAPYLHGLHLNHGYRFFAPNPGPSHLVRYQILVDGGPPIEGQFPDPQQHWPRQLYHRHFMISETMYGLSDRVAEAPEEPRATEGEVPPPEAMAEYREAKAVYDRDKQRSDALANGLARQLMSRYQGRGARLWIVEHGIPLPQLVEQGLELSDPSLYRERLLGEWGEVKP